jgi:Glycosyltransferase family 92
MKLLKTAFMLCWVLVFPFLLYAKYELSVCAIFQNEAPFLKEWIEFHKLQGVQHFFLYNNNSDDDFLDVLDPYIKSGEITLKEWPFRYPHENHAEWLSIQTRAYMNCIRQYGVKTTWLACIDIDEFLFCPNGMTVVSFLKNYQAFGGLCVYWRVFGTSHLETIPPNVLMIEALTKCSHPKSALNQFVKSIVQPKFVADCHSAHTFIYKNNYFAIDTDGNVVNSGNVPYCIQDKIRINHYWTRTESWFRERKIPSIKARGREDQIQLAESCNLDDDTAILQFVPTLRDAVFNSLSATTEPSIIHH